MGVIIKQSFWGTAIAYIGVLVGFVNTLYLRPQFFLMDEIGLFGIITANAMMISPFTSFGMSSSYIKFFPIFPEKDRNTAFTYLLVLVMVGCSITLILGFLLQDVIKARYIETAPEYINYLSITAIIIVVNSFFDMFFSYSRSTLQVLFPSFLRDVFLRIGAIVLVVGFAFNWFSFEWAVKGLAINYSLAFLFLFGKLTLTNGFRFNFKFGIFSKEWKSELFKFAIYSMLLAGSFAIMNNVSYEQVTSMLGSTANGIFVTCFFMGTIVEMPRRNMAKVISPILSSEIEKGNMIEVEKLYKKGSITMSILGVLIFIGILTNLEDLLLFIPKGDEFKEGFFVVVFVCVAKLSIMISSFPGEIINFSQFYRYNLLFQFCTAVILITLNYFMIPVWGLEGAAFSYFLAIFIHVVVKILYVKYRFNIQPFVRPHFKLLVISVITGVIAYAFKVETHPVALIFLRSSITTLVFVLLIYKLKISTDINRLIHSTFERFLKVNLPK